MLSQLLDVKEGGCALILVAKFYATKCLLFVAEYPEPPSWFPNLKHAKDKPFSIDMK